MDPLRLSSLAKIWRQRLLRLFRPFRRPSTTNYNSRYLAYNLVQCNRSINYIMVLYISLNKQRSKGWYQTFLYWYIVWLSGTNVSSSLNHARRKREYIPCIELFHHVKHLHKVPISQDLLFPTRQSSCGPDNILDLPAIDLLLIKVPHLIGAQSTIGNISIRLLEESNPNFPPSIRLEIVVPQRYINPRLESFADAVRRQEEDTLEIS